MKKGQSVEALENFEAWNPGAAELIEGARRVYEPAETLTRWQRNWAVALSFIAAGIMVETLFFKFTGAAESKYIFTKMGTEPWMRWVQGLWELLASVCLLRPRWRWAGGVLTVGAMAAAILSHLTWLGISIQGDRGLLFAMAVTTFTSGFVVMMIHRHSIPHYVSLSHW